MLNFLGGAMPRLRRMGWRVDLEGMVAAFIQSRLAAARMVWSEPSQDHERDRPEDVESVAVNLILNFQHIKFDEYADYQINLSIDDVGMAVLPLRVREMPRPHMA